MWLVLIFILSLFLYIQIPSIYTPSLFLGILAVYIVNKQYWLIGFGLAIIVLFLQMTSLENWWEIAIYYSLWSLGIYFASILLDKSWAVQSIIATIWLIICKLILSGFMVDYMNIIIYTIVNGIGIAIFLYFSEKLKIYE